MLRYTALVWDAENESQASCAQRLIQAHANGSWAPVFETPGVSVLCAGAHTSELRPLAGGRGILLGSLFRQFNEPTRAPWSPAVVTPSEEDEIVRSGGRELVRRFWGNYVAVLCDPTRRTRCIVRGPAASLPCLHTSVEGINLYFSWMESVAWLGGRSFSIHWMHVARTLLGPLCSEQTSIREVREILPGMCDELRPSSRTKLILWDPIAVATANPITEPKEAARCLRTSIRASIHAWASQYSCVLHCLSGGLDSSIVLACLADAHSHTRIICFTQFADAAESDERAFARVAAQRANCPLIEHRRTAELDLRDSMSPLHFETSVGFRAPAIDRIEPDVARSVGAEAVFRGNGGDELFCRHHLSLSVADFIRHRGLGAGLFDLLTHVAVIEGDTAWRILGRALVNAFVPRRWNLAAILDDDQEGFSLLTTEVVQTLLAASTFDFPYARGTSDAAPGRLWQVSLLTARRPFYSPFMRADDPDTVSPLLSQPVIEACLRIPTHFQSIGRRDRALARTAFAQDLPPAIAGRSDKGDVEQLAGAILTRNRSFIREMLLEGLLVRERLVNRARLETALSDAPSHAFPGSAAVFELLGAEIWARAWHVRP